MAPVNANALRQLLHQLGYTILERADAWSECYVANASEHWRGRGIDADEAFADVLRQMLPSALARHLLEAHTPASPASEPLAPTSATAPAQAPSALKLRAAAATEAGGAPELAPEANVCLLERGLVAVVDGVKSSLAGATAAKTVVAELGRTFEAAASLSPVRMRGLPLLLAALQRANKELVEAAKRDAKLRGMVAHFAAALAVDGQVVLAGIGGCRIYRLRGGALEVLETEAKADKPKAPAGGKAKAVRALGADRALDLDASVVPAQPGDVLLLCTDGLHESVAQEELFDVLRTIDDPAEAVRALLSRAAAKGEAGVATAAMLRFDGEPAHA